MITILGAGLSGLIAATQFPEARVYEASSSNTASHRAVLRFRTDSLSRLTGIPFRKVMVRKSIWYGRAYHQPSIRLANMYSLKTNGSYMDRSIWNIDAVERFIAPETLHSELAALAGNRINWSVKINFDDIEQMRGDSIISTIPMPAMIKLLSGDEEMAKRFNFAPIVVDRYRVRDSDVFQTIYYPDPKMAVYRASITGSLLIVERKGPMAAHEYNEVLESFGLECDDVSIIELSHAQRYGKITPVDDKFRRNMIFNFTRDMNIYSLGRFAIWKNVLLDDVVDDVAVIKRLISQGLYGAALHHSK